MRGDVRVVLQLKSLIAPLFAPLEISHTAATIKASAELALAASPISSFHTHKNVNGSETKQCPASLTMNAS
jgi:hypothetical protein